MAKDKLEKGKPAVQLTVKGVAVWGGLIVFVMGWMFVLGILVGRGTAPVENLETHLLEKDLANLKAEKLAQENEKLREQVEQSQGVVEKLPFYEKLKEDPAKIESRQKIATASVAKPKPTPIPEPTPIPKPKPTPEAAKPRPKDKPAPAPQPVKQANNVKSAPETEPKKAKGRYTVQVASFKAQDSADKLVATLKSKGYAAYHVHTAVPDMGDLYRVRVGSFEGRSDAESILKKLGKDRVKGIVVSTQ